MKKKFIDYIQNLTFARFVKLYIIYMILLSIMWYLSGCASVDPAKRYANTHKDKQFKTYKVR